MPTKSDSLQNLKAIIATLDDGLSKLPDDNTFVKANIERFEESISDSTALFFQFYVELQEYCDELDDENELKHTLQSSLNELKGALDNIECSSAVLTANNQDGPSRRGLLSSLAAFAGVGAVGAIGMQPSKAHAFADAGAVITYLSTTVVPPIATIINAIRTVNDGIGEINGLIDDVNGVLNDGISGLLTQEMEAVDKQVTAIATSADKVADTIVEQSKIKNELANQPGSGTCTSDASSVVAGSLKKKNVNTTRNATQESVKKALSTSRDQGRISEQRGRILAKKLSNGDHSSADASPLTTSEPFDGNPSSRQSKNREDLIESILAEPSDLRTGNLELAKNNQAGRSWIADHTTRQSRRSLAEAALRGGSERNATSKPAFLAMQKQIRAASESVIQTDAVGADGKPLPQRKDSRLQAHGQDLLGRLESLNDDSGGAGISEAQLTEFQVNAFNSPSFFEYIRSSGSEPAPLLRELIYQQSVKLELLHKTLEEEQTQTALLATLLLETQDNPAVIDKLNKKKTR